MMSKTNPYVIGFTAFAFLLAALAGCSATRQNLPPVAETQPMKPKAPLEDQWLPKPEFNGSLYESNGSLYATRSMFNDFFIDTKARKVGDIVTVKISESSKATNSADTKTGRTSSLEAGIDTLFDIEDWYENRVLDEIPNKLPRPNPFGNPSIKGNMSSDFDGAGSTSRSGDLNAFITCRVTELLPNGNLKIVGSREILVNHETQMIILSGIIRPRDIDDDNVILSTFVSDARIAYSGSGIVHDRQRPGWLANLLNSVWPF
ncbi:MAG: flagellar basal body L-ring protein FlgH [Desulfobacterales bacterium]|jgi:flagellar L-ring protein precursor FlgH|nr:flagellar basal body L-ring protein FlgH [Deltaproteobacteria bacterium]